MDSRIALSGQPVNFMLPGEAVQRGLQTNAMAQKNAMAEMAMQDQLAAQESKKQLNALWKQSGGDMDAMLQSGQLDMDTAMQLMQAKGEQAKLQGQANKEQAIADKERIKAGIEKLNYGSQLLAGANANNWQQIRSEFGRMTGMDLGENYDQGKVQSLMQQGLTMKDRLANEWKAKGYELDVAKFGEQRRHNVVTEGISQQNANRYSEGSDAQSVKYEKIYDPQGRAYFVNPKDPTAPPIPIRTESGDQMGKSPAKGTSKAPTEGQANAALYSARMESADAILNNLGDKYNPVAVSAIRSGGITGAAANMASSPESQQAAQAQRDFVNAVLRRESGAAISDAEFDNASKQYFPQYGDSKEVIEQKAQNRALAIEGIKRAAGPAALDSSNRPTKRMTAQQLQSAADAKFGGDIDAARRAAEQYGYTVE